MSTALLRRLSDLPDYEVTPDCPDVRGWTLRGHAGQALGTVYELLVDPQAGQVRYLDVELDARLPVREFENHVLLPLAPAVLDAEGRSVFMTALDEEAILQHPPYSSL